MHEALGVAVKFADLSLLALFKVVVAAVGASKSRRQVAGFRTPDLFEKSMNGRIASGLSTAVVRFDKDNI